MKKTLLLLSLSAFIYANELSSLIEKAQKNELVEIYKQKLKASQLEYDATGSAYLPRLDLGAAAQLTTPKGPLDAGQIYNAKLEASYVILDGFKRENLLDEKETLIKANEFNLEDAKKQVSKNVASLYFNLKNISSDIKALEQKKEQLVEQLAQQEKFFSVKLVTEDNVERIKAAVANVDYEIEAKKYFFDEARAKIFTLTNVLVEDADDSSLQEPLYDKEQTLDSLKSLKKQAEALKFKAEQADSAYYPTLVIKDELSYTHFADDSFDDFKLPAPPGQTSVSFERQEAQNKLMLSFKMNIIDFSSASEIKQAIMANQNALNAQLAYKTKEAKASLALAKRAIERSKKLLEASKLSMNASDRTFEIVNKKYKARVVDYVKYLDSLSQQTTAKAQYNRALGALEISYAAYYAEAGLDVKDFIK